MILAKHGSKATIGLWFVAMLVIGIALLEKHTIPVAAPRKTDTAVLAREIEALRDRPEDRRWMLVHVLSSGCRCSARIADHLAGSKRPEDVVEKVVLVGESAEIQQRLSRFDVAVVTEAELLERFHVEGAPLLIVAAPDASLRYVGGYTDRKQGPAPQDRPIFEALRSGREVAPLPSFGCTVDARMRSTNDIGQP